MNVSKFRLAVLVFVFVYPVITAIQYALVPLTKGWEVWERSLVMVPIMVGLMVYTIIPTIQKRFKAFLVRQK